MSTGHYNENMPIATITAAHGCFAQPRNPMDYGTQRGEQVRDPVLSLNKAIN